MAREMIATPAEGMPPKRDAHRGAHPETAESCLGTGEMEDCQTVQIGEVSGGGRAEAKARTTATAGADPEPAKSLVNAAAMRQALSDACYAMFNFLKTQNGGYEEMANALDKAKVALAKPPRNCDVGTAEEQAERKMEYCYKQMGCSNCSFSKSATLTQCALAWSQMPYEAN